MSQNNKQSIVEVRDLLIEFGLGRKKVKAVKGVTFDVYKGETFGLVGESGSGKTTVGRAIMGIQPVSDGTIYFDQKVARGEAPDLYKLNKAIEKNIEIMLDNQNATTVRINNYLNEYKRTYYKYIFSKFYDFKTLELKDYPDGVDRRIPEGVNVKDTKLINIKKEANIKFIEESINDNLKRLIKIIRIFQKTMRFSERLSNFIDIEPRVDEAISKNLQEAYEMIINIKGLENKIHKHLTEMNKIRKDAYEGKYTSVSKFFEDLGKLLQTIIKNHKSISTLIAIVKKQAKINSALTSPENKRKKYKDWVKEKIDENEKSNNKMTLIKYTDIYEVLNLKSVDTAVKNSSIFRKPKRKDLRDLKKDMQMIFQDPASSLNDRMPVEEIIGEGLANFPELYKNDETVQVYLDWYNQDKSEDSKITKEQVRYKDVKHFLILQLLTTVGMLPEHLSRYPHEFSGGQRQRIGIARALVMRPKFIVADEPISALDVSIRAQVMNLLTKFQKEFDLTYIFIAHDLSVVRFIANRIAVIYRGDIVELAEADELFNNPLHPYTKSLLSAVPLPDPEQEKKKVHFKYEPEKEHYDYLVDFPYWQEVQPGHFVYANEREAKKYRNKK